MSVQLAGVILQTVNVAMKAANAVNENVNAAQNAADNQMSVADLGKSFVEAMTSVFDSVKSEAGESIQNIAQNFASALLTSFMGAMTEVLNVMEASLTAGQASTQQAEANQQQESSAQQEQGQGQDAGAEQNAPEQDGGYDYYSGLGY
jgi:hypothetical protein